MVGQLGTWHAFTLLPCFVPSIAVFRLVANPNLECQGGLNPKLY